MSTGSLLPFQLRRWIFGFIVTSNAPETEKSATGKQPHQGNPSCCTPFEHEGSIKL
jgi:hypothetical protein